jgi:hypothetical protein
MSDEPLAALIDSRLTAAGIGEDDPGLVKLRQWNATVWRNAGVPPVPEPVGEAEPSDYREGRDKMGKVACGREGCGADIEWALSRDSDSRMPVDYWSAGDPKGNLAIARDDESGRLFYRVLTKARPDLRRGERRGVAHWTTCKNPPPRKAKAKQTCAQCPHPPHTSVCTRLGRLECRMSGNPAGEGLVEMRGRFPCGCEHGVEPVTDSYGGAGGGDD